VGGALRVHGIKNDWICKTCEPVKCLMNGAILKGPPNGYHVLNTSRPTLIAVCPCNKYAFCAFRQRDWLQQYANAKSLQKFANIFANFCKLLQTFTSFWSIYFILFYFTCEREAWDRVFKKFLRTVYYTRAVTSLTGYCKTTGNCRRRRDQTQRFHYVSPSVVAVMSRRRNRTTGVWWYCWNSRSVGVCSRSAEFTTHSHVRHAAAFTTHSRHRSMYPHFGQCFMFF